MDTQSNQPTTSSIVPSPPSDPRDKLVHSILDSTLVQNMKADTMHRWSELMTKINATKEAIDKINTSIQTKRTPKSLKINIAINLPDKMKDDSMKILQYIDEAQTKIIQMILSARQSYLSILEKEQSDFFSSVKCDLNDYLKEHIADLPNAFSASDKQKAVPIDLIISTFVESIKHDIAIKMNNHIIAEKEKQRKHREQLEADTQAEEQLKTNPQKSIEQLIDERVKKEIAHMLLLQQDRRKPMAAKRKSPTDSVQPGTIDSHPSKKQQRSEPKPNASNQSSKHKNNERVKQPSSKHQFNSVPKDNVNRSRPSSKPSRSASSNSNSKSALAKNATPNSKSKN